MVSNENLIKTLFHRHCEQKITCYLQFNVKECNMDIFYFLNEIYSHIYVYRSFLRKILPSQFMVLVSKPEKKLNLHSLLYSFFLRFVRISLSYPISDTALFPAYWCQPDLSLLFEQMVRITKTSQNRAKNASSCLRWKLIMPSQLPLCFEENN